MQAIELRVDGRNELRSQNRWQDFAGLEKLPVALGLGCLLGLSSPGFDQAWLAWCGLAPLLVLIALCRRASEALFVGFAFGFGYHLVALSWIWGFLPMHWMGLEDQQAMRGVGVVWALESAHEAIVYAVFAWLIAGLPLRPGFLPRLQRPFFSYLLTVPIVWLFLHWVASPSPYFLGIPIDQLAYSQSSNTAFIQLAKIGGPGLVDFMLALTNAAIASCVVEFSKFGQQPVERVDVLSPRAGALFDLSLVAALLLAAMAWGNSQIDTFGQIENYKQPKLSFAQAPRMPLAVVQPNVTLEEERIHTVTPEELLQRKKSLSQGLPVSMLILPEGVAEANLRVPDPLMNQMEKLAQQEKKLVIAGEITRRPGEVINVAYLLSPEHRKRQQYIKCKLIPFIEWSPWQELINQLPASWQGFIPVIHDVVLCDDKPQLLRSNWGKIGVSISGELLYPHFIAREVRDGASLLINVSDFAPLHKSSFAKAFLATAIFRAVENERYVVLASNTGISAVINPAGIVTSMSVPGKKGTLIDTVQFLYGKTPFTKMWWL
jgi:apolipoprotein N-acyltransferase